MWQQLIVFCIVALAAAHAGAKYLPLSWRLRLVYVLNRCGAPHSPMAAWFKTTPSCGDGCASCGSCRSDPVAPTVQRVIKLHVRS